jgi:hypothetical protein
VYYARRAAVWLIPLVRRYAVDLGQQAVDLRERVAHSRLPQTLLAGAVGCTLVLPSLAAPVRDLHPVPQPPIGDRPLAQVGTCCGTRAPKPAVDPPENQVRAKPAATGDARGRPPADECSASCARSWQDNSHPSKSHKKSKKKQQKG